MSFCYNDDTQLYQDDAELIHTGKRLLLSFNGGISAADRTWLN
jgi:hypothetical protein